jgi:hypothetical protein
MRSKKKVYFVSVFVFILIAFSFYLFLNLNKKSPLSSLSSLTEEEISMDKVSTDQDFLQAKETLITYFVFLQKKEYEKAVFFQGNPYVWESLRGWNPTIDPQNYTALLKAGCEGNGLQCLAIKEVKQVQQISSNEFRFTVQFINIDGDLFEMGPCCGEQSTQPARTEFNYVVKKEEDGFKVTTSPIYVP